MITLKFFTTLRILLRISEIHIHEQVLTIREVLTIGEKRTGKPFLYKILDPQGGLLTGSIILVNGHNILHLEGLETKLGDGDMVALFPPGGGG